jgi:glycosyltransferase involved in cell wall biosynthesis
MRIGIDARLYSQTGVGRYIQNLTRELAVIDSENSYLIYLRKRDYFDFKLPNRRWTKRILDVAWHTIQEQFIVPYVFLRDKIDVAHFPYFNVPIFYPKNYLLTIHDLIVDHFDTGRASTYSYPLYKIKRIGYKLSLSSGIKRAGAISAISETTKKEIIDHYHVPDGKITITYDALDRAFSELAKQKPQSFYSFPYILYVGNAYPHKNLERMIDAFVIVLKKQPIKLILAGNDNYFYPRLKLYVQKLGLLENIIFFGEADDRELINLYNNALCLVFPSLMEGFGLPNLEAIACGRLSVISDIPAFHEVWGDKLIYFNPLDPDDIANKILDIINLPKDEYDRKVKKAKQRLQDFSWKKTGVTTLKLYEQIYR